MATEKAVLKKTARYLKNKGSMKPYLELNRDISMTSTENSTAEGDCQVE